MLNIDDEYIAYCLDSACAYITQMAAEKKKPRFPRQEKPRRGVTASGQNITTNSEQIAKFRESMQNRKR